MAKSLSICLLHYNRVSALRKHVALWQSYPDTIKRNVRFIIIDDGSRPALEPVDFDFSSIDVHAYRIHEDILWNIGGARNLAAHVAQTKWILIQDSDVFISGTILSSIRRICRWDLRCRTIYKFGRINPLSGRDSPHPGTMLLPRDLYWEVGGCDEDFVGHYGFTDVHFFRQRVASTPRTKVKVLSRIKLTEDGVGSTRGLNRSNSRNESLYHEKVLNQSWSTDHLRFTWSRIF